jgi:tRNA(Ile2) C34 agmatinyltransferase TiaS
MKKVASNICRDCGNTFRGKIGAFRCKECAIKEARYRHQRERMRRALPFYLKANT